MKKLLDKKTLIIISAVIIALGVVISFFPGANLGADYKAGTMAIISFNDEFKTSDLTDALKKENVSFSEVQTATSNAASVVVYGDNAQTAIEKAVEALKGTYAKVELTSSGAISAAHHPAELLLILLPILAAIIAMFIYLWVVCGLKASIYAAVSMVAASLMTVALIVICRIEVTQFVSGVLLAGALITFSNVILLSRKIKNVEIKNSDQTRQEKAVSKLGITLWIMPVLFTLFGVVLVILAPTPMKMIGFGSIITAVTTIFSTIYLLPSLYNK